MQETEKLLMIGGDGHGQVVEVAEGVTTLDGEQGLYHRRTMRFVARDPRNPRSVALRRYWAADVLVHDSMADDNATAYAWWQNLADVRLFKQHGRDVTDIPEERERFRPVERERQ